MFTTDELRPYCDELPLCSSTVPLIMITVDCVEYAKTVVQKRGLLKKFKSCRKRNKVLISVWPGQWSSDVFIVDFEEAVKRLGD